MWLRPERDSPLVVSIYLARNAVGVFIRGARGATPGETLALLEPMAEPLSAALASPWVARDNGYFFGDSRPVVAFDEATWPEAIDWLHERARLYLASLAGIRNAVP
jgi:hypothetical protein